MHLLFPAFSIYIIFPLSIFPLNKLYLQNEIKHPYIIYMEEQINDEKWKSEAREKARLAMEEAQRNKIEAQKAHKESVRNERKKLFVMALLFFAAAVVIVYIFPSSGRFKYNYEVGKPWAYENLTAPSSFPIQKSSSEIDREYGQLLRQSYRPCYTVDNNTADKMQKIFAEISSSKSTAIATAHSQYIAAQLKEIYKEGILSNDDLDRLNKMGIKSIKIRKQDSEGGPSYYTEQPIKNIYTIKNAYEKIIEAAPAGLDKNILRSYNINNVLVSNLDFDKEISDQLRSELYKEISLNKGMVQNGEKIIDHGDIVSPHTYEILNSLRSEMETGHKSQRSTSVLTGQSICILCILSAFFLYMGLFRKRFVCVKNIFFMLCLIVGLCALTASITKLGNEEIFVTVYLIPYALLPITISTFFDTRTALFSHLTTVLLCSLIAPHEFEFLMLQIIVGMICISTLKNIYQRAQLIRSAGIIAGIYILCYSGLALIQNGGWERKDNIVLVSFIINGGLLLFAYPFIYIMEKLFSFVSDVTLVELTNTNNPLLLQFAEVAPGSFQHSLQVSNLAADAAIAIGANPMLARAGGLYHDIGKIGNPIYFTENQKDFNPHQFLTERESVQVITRHVTDGIIIAKKNGLPQQIQDFIETHHGKNLVRYFYNTYVNRHPDEAVDKALFSYQGKLPATKETAIVMMCDAVEAASKSLDKYTDETINTLVENIIGTQIKECAFAEAPITIKEIEEVKNTLKEKLKNMYHTRIRYPELRRDTNVNVQTGK